MELIASAGEREERVRVERADGGLSVTVGEKSYLVDAVHAGGVGGEGRDGLYSLRLGGDQYEVAVHHLSGGRYRVSGAGGATEVEVTDPLSHLARASRGGGGARRAGPVTADMPGRVVAVLAAEGDEVVQGQGLVVVEAMKMENEIAADRDGVVARLHVAPGQSVEGGEPLFEIAPADAG